jgi:thioredoxin reductase
VDTSSGTGRAPTYDVVIVGGGPAGLNAALVLARARRQVVVVDAGQPRNAAAREMHGFLTRDGISPLELLAAGRLELARYGVAFIEGRVVAAEAVQPSPAYPHQTGFTLETKEGNRLVGRKLLLATGVSDDVPELPGVRECYGRTVHHCPYCDGWEHRGKHLLAVANTAKESVGLGLSLRSWSDTVTVLTNGMPADDRGRRKLHANGIKLREEPVLAVRHTNGQLHSVELAAGEPVRADALFFNTAARANATEILRVLGCEMDPKGVACSSGKQKTNVPGLYLAGDADGDVQFVIVAAAEGATAAVAINRELQQEDRSLSEG